MFIFQTLILVPVSRKTENTISTCMIKQTLKLIKNVEKDISLKETLAEIRTEMKEQHQKNTVSVENIIFPENHIILNKSIQYCLFIRSLFTYSLNVIEKYRERSIKYKYYKI